MNDNPDGRTPATDECPTSIPDETFRAMLRAQMLEGEPTALIVTRRGLGGAGHVWLTGNGRITTTVVLTRQEAEQLAGMLWDASSVWGTQ
ncbi:MAG: hypothetical protein ACRDQ4_17730 [Pseudonocardiaceae bacterium]